MAHFTESGLRETELGEKVNIDLKQWCSSSMCSNAFCCHWKPLLLTKDYSWFDVARKSLEKPDLRPGTVVITRTDRDNLYGVGYLPDDFLWFYHQCANVSIKNMWYLPVAYGSKRVVDMVHRNFARRGRALMRQDEGCKGDFCVWLTGTLDEIMSRVLPIYIWMTRQPYYLQSGELKDAWKERLINLKDIDRGYDFALCNSEGMTPLLVPSFAQDAGAFSSSRNERLKRIESKRMAEDPQQGTGSDAPRSPTETTSTTNKIPSIPVKVTTATDASGSTTEITNTTNKAPSTPVKLMATATENSFLLKPTMTGLADSMNNLNVNALTPPSSPGRLSFAVGDFLTNAKVEFLYLGEGKGTTCNISLHIPSGGDLPAWLKDRNAAN